MHGRHLGEFLGKPPTGKEFGTKQIHIWRLEDGKVIEHWSVRDDLGQALQLGLIGS
jgi:predicted ester cyclase